MRPLELVADIIIVVAVAIVVTEVVEIVAIGVNVVVSITAITMVHSVGSEVEDGVSTAAKVEVNCNFCILLRMHLSLLHS